MIKVKSDEYTEIERQLEVSMKENERLSMDQGSVIEKLNSQLEEAKKEIEDLEDLCIENIKEKQISESQLSECKRAITESLELLKVAERNQLFGFEESSRTKQLSKLIETLTKINK